MAEARLQPGTPSLSSLVLAGHTPEPRGTAQLSPCALWSFLLLRGWKKLKSTRPHIKPALQMTHQGYTLFTSGIFLLILSPMHLFCCLLLFQTHFSAPCTDFWTTFDKDDPGSRVINIIFLTCLALSATCNCSLPRFGSSSLTFLQLPRSFPCFLSPWVCAAFSVSS